MKRKRTSSNGSKNSANKSLSCKEDIDKTNKWNDTLKIPPFKTFSAVEFDKISSMLYGGRHSLDIVVMSLQNKSFAKILDCIDEYIVLGKEQYYLRNKKRAYRIFVSIICIIKKYASYNIYCK